MRLSLRLPSAFTIGCIGCLLASAAVAYWDRPSPLDPEFLVEPAEFELADLPLGRYELVVRITNPALIPRRIVGLKEYCAADTCCASKHPDQITIPPGATFEYHFELLVKRLGPIDTGMDIYFEENGIRTVTLRVTGTAVEAPRAPR